MALLHKEDERGARLKEQPTKNTDSADKPRIQIKNKSKHTSNNKA